MKNFRVWDLQTHQDGSITIRQCISKPIGLRGITRREVIEIEIDKKEIEKITLKELLAIMEGK